MIKVKKGIDLPLSGQPAGNIENAPACQTVAITGPDYVGMRPSLLVKVGDHVEIGQPVFSCKKNVGLVFTSPASGTVKAINRGERRVFQTLVIQLDGKESHAKFPSFDSVDLSKTDGVRQLLVESGLWASLRERPFDKTPQVKGDLPKDIFVSVGDTNPLAPDPALIIKENQNFFAAGLKALSGLATRNLFVCNMDGQSIALPELPNLKKETFAGKHPAGNVGTHMSHLSPPTLASRVWYVGYQDVIAIGHLFETGRLMTDRYIGVGGPLCRSPRILKTRLGANLSEILEGEVKNDAPARLVSGSVFNGREVDPTFAYLGAFHHQVSILEEDDDRELLGWHLPGFDKYSVKNVFFSRLLPKPNYRITTSTHGSPRALVPFGHFEKVCALDTLATPLLKALLVKDTDLAQQLGALELGEEDMALFTFVSTGKTDFGPILRTNLDIIEKEG